ncbi:MAG: DegT/DnrJ/EryC1/StrS family aminotransferase [Planctomycetes bacterium]|nr:DegT/DnrJ/EryC1/StrS family aminotransferase [Planctomycetota bacterium]MBI3836241.1 DegT/DnrJ/EryC1/StrS family aminotransferase [Planctomycetota bacterium]
MLDLKAEYGLMRERIRAVVDEVLESQHHIGGPAIAKLEEAIAKRIGVEHAIAISSGTDALLCALMAIEVGPGDEVIVPSFTFFATAGVVHRLGASPKFVDIDPGTFNIDPRGIEAAISKRTKAIMPVHLFGQCADMKAINTIAKKHGVRVIEDAAQAIGAKQDGRHAGTFGDLACLSFYPTKNLGGFGEGGMILTNNEKLGTLCKQLRTHGESTRYHHERVGGNFRLDTMKAAILLVKLDYLDEFTRRRRHNAARYDELLGKVQSSKFEIQRKEATGQQGNEAIRQQGDALSTPFVASGNVHVYHQYSILCDRRDELAAYLRDRGIGTGVYYPVPLHLQKCFTHLGYKPGSLPITEQSCTRILSLPCHPMLTEDDLQNVASCIAEFHK